MLASLLAFAIGLWGAIYPGPAPTPVAFNVTTALPSGTLAYTHPGGYTGGAQWVYVNGGWWFVASRYQCVIDISPTYTSWPLWLQRNVVAHEYGHCLGMPHSATRCNLMYPAFSQCQALTEADKAQARRNMGEGP
jgi:hypothetical protein